MNAIFKKRLKKRLETQETSDTLHDDEKSLLGAIDIWKTLGEVEKDIYLSGLTHGVIKLRRSL